MSLPPHYFKPAKSKARPGLNARLSKDAQSGFILLEVLAAMSLIVGTWMAMIYIYQGLVLRQTQLQVKKIELRKESDVFEISEHARNVRNISSGVLNHESTRVSSRTRSVHGATQSTTKNKR
jgi:hypothetical protein